MLALIFLLWGVEMLALLLQHCSLVLLFCDCSVVDSISVLCLPTFKCKITARCGIQSVPHTTKQLRSFERLGSNIAREYPSILACKAWQSSMAVLMASLRNDDVTGAVGIGERHFRLHVEEVSYISYRTFDAFARGPANPRARPAWVMGVGGGFHG
jgi:hypothetical protein